MCMVMCLMKVVKVVKMVEVVEVVRVVACEEDVVNADGWDERAVGTETLGKWRGSVPLHSVSVTGHCHQRHQRHLSTAIYTCSTVLFHCSYYEIMRLWDYEFMRLRDYKIWSSLFFIWRPDVYSYAVDGRVLLVLTTSTTTPRIRMRVVLTNQQIDRHSNTIL